jgi:hypothetical protein
MSTRVLSLEIKQWGVKLATAHCIVLRLIIGAVIVVLLLYVIVA